MPGCNGFLRKPKKKIKRAETQPCPLKSHAAMRLGGKKLRLWAMGMKWYDLAAELLRRLPESSATRSFGTDFGRYPIPASRIGSTGQQVQRLKVEIVLSCFVQSSTRRCTLSDSI